MFSSSVYHKLRDAPLVSFLDCQLVFFIIHFLLFSLFFVPLLYSLLLTLVRSLRLLRALQ